MSAEHAEILRPGGGTWPLLVFAALLSGQDVDLAPIELDMTGLAEFRTRVYAVTRAIPRGSTRTYTQVARALGNPKAVRAVARACATNPVSIVVPCHRVIREDGSLAGYRWGLSRKEQLLAQERAAV